MLTEQQAKKMMIKFIKLRSICQQSNTQKNKRALERYERVCIEKFQYLIDMRTARYRNFNNYEDLQQEGLIALIKAMKNYNPRKGSWFWWAHRYIDTKIARSANLHSIIKFPLHYAKIHHPRKVPMFPLMITTEEHSPDKTIELAENKKVIYDVVATLNPEHQNIIALLFGLHNNKPMSINRVCHKLRIPRKHCIEVMNNALISMREHIRL